jgi:hypothetical protein
MRSLKGLLVLTYCVASVGLAAGAGAQKTGSRSPVARVKAWWSARSANQAAIREAEHLGSAVELADPAHAVDMEALTRQFHELTSLTSRLSTLREQVDQRTAVARGSAVSAHRLLVTVENATGTKLEQVNQHIDQHFGKRIAALDLGPTKAGRTGLVVSLGRHGYGYEVEKESMGDHVSKVVEGPLGDARRELREGGARVVADAEALKAKGLPVDVEGVRNAVDAKVAEASAALEQQLRLEVAPKLFSIKHITAADYERTKSEGAARRQAEQARVERAEILEALRPKITVNQSFHTSVTRVNKQYGLINISR